VALQRHEWRYWHNGGRRSAQHCEHERWQCHPWQHTLTTSGIVAKKSFTQHVGGWGIPIIFIIVTSIFATHATTLPVYTTVMIETFVEHRLTEVRLKPM
jgi:hypothetical protein